MSRPEAPNILFLQTDQQRWDALGCLNSEVRTPTLDRLAAGGMHCMQATANCPICVPSRHSMMLGLYPFQSGIRFNRQIFPTDAHLPVPTLAQRLATAGYQTAGYGKTHWFEANLPGVEPTRRGFEHRGLMSTRNTLDVFCSDHCEMPGDRNHRFSKYCLYEGSIRVPVILGGDALTKHLCGSRYTAPVELVDILPTLIAAAGVEADSRLSGRNLFSAPPCSGAFAEFYGGGYETRQVGPMWMWRTPEWKLIRRLEGLALDNAGGTPSPASELYHLSEDPLELRNRYVDSSVREIRLRLESDLLDHVQAHSALYPRALTDVFL